TADKEHRELATAPGLDFQADFFNFRHFFYNELFHIPDQVPIAEIGGHFTEGFGACLRSDKVHLEPWNSVLGFHHFGEVIYRTVAHYHVEVDHLRAGELVVL